MTQHHRLPVLPLRDVVVFPGAPAPLIVGRARSVAALEAASRGDGRVLLLTQQRGDLPHPSAADLHEIGTIAQVEQLLRLPDGNTKALLDGKVRGRVLRFLDGATHLSAEVEVLDDAVEPGADLPALISSVKGAVERYVKLNRAAPPDLLMGVNAVSDPGRLADVLVGVLKLTWQERQELLATLDVVERLKRVHKALLHEIEFLQVERKLHNRARRDRSHTEREAWLDDQVKAIHKDAGGSGGDGREDLDEIKALLAEKPLPEAAMQRATRELRRLAQMNPMSAEAAVVRNYLDWLLALPWTERSDGAPVASDAATILDSEHFGLTKVKDRILEHLAVATLRERPTGPVLCLVGPPGVGKTSLARSIAAATGKPFARVALGGVRDEAEIRGHRRTYIGAMPGRILQGMKRAAAVDAVVLLDEVDKMSSDMRGDPASALLEVLDPEQNHAFSDHYLDLDYDLSSVMFVCTANTLQGVPLPLLDRLEVIELSGYTEEEKRTIAERYLIPKQREATGLTEDHVRFSDDALRHIIRRYTRESGVRGLERRIGAVCRKVARRVVEHGDSERLDVEVDALEDLLGTPRHEPGRREKEDEVGLVKGLSVSSTGGELINIEVAAVPGKGKLILTGKLGDVLKESATAAFTYVRSRAAALGLDAEFHETHDFHVHYPGLPSGVEGPSAGIAMTTALVSALTGIPARADTAMTGELTLRGRVLPIGGVREKVLAAHRGGITRVLLPEANRKDLRDIPEPVREVVDLIFVSHLDRVLAEALTSLPVGAAARRADGASLSPLASAAASEQGR